jgi:hypothetical protein
MIRVLLSVRTADADAPGSEILQSWVWRCDKLFKVIWPMVLATPPVVEVVLVVDVVLVVLVVLVLLVVLVVLPPCREARGLNVTAIL